MAGEALNGVMSEEARLELAVAAARAERANRPRHLVLLAGLLLVSALAALLWSYGSYASARAAAGREEETTKKTIQMAARLKALQERAASGPSVSEVNSQLLSKILQAERDAGIKDVVSVPKRTSVDRVPAQKVANAKHTYEVRDESLAALLAWMQKATSDVPGLEVFGVTLKPEAQKWYLEVTFSKWERAEGT